MPIQHIRLVDISKGRKDLPLLVFLPGMDGSGLSLQQQLGKLRTVFDARYFSIPGDDTTDWVGLVTKLVELIALEQISQNRSVYLCGESFGACLALKAVSHRPDLFNRLVLINPASSFSRQVWSSLGTSIVKWIPEEAYRSGAIGLLPFLIAFDRVSKHNHQALLDAIQKISPETVAWRLSLLRDFRLNKALLSQFKIPTLLLASAADRLLPSISEAQRLAALFQNSQTITLNHSGHACLLEDEVNLYHLLQQAQFLPKIKIG